MKHPLLESVTLDHAAGILVNFTGGDDLTLYEVTQALNYLQEQVASELEIVMGVVHDDCMKNRVQAILIVTGLGGKSLEDVLPGAERLNQAMPRPVQIAAQYCQTVAVEANLGFEAKDLDIPAFLRRRRFS
jgi:cell division protein FtsZ